MNDVKQYKATLGQLLSVTTGIMCVEDFGDVMDFVSFVAQEPIWLHDMKRVADEVKPILIQQHPFLPECDGLVLTGDKCLDSVKSLESKYGKFHMTYHMYFDDHESLDPDDSLKRTGFTGDVIVFNTDELDDED